jgi:curli biogenesis system outer membrane secretion channel CsgG
MRTSSILLLLTLNLLISGCAQKVSVKALEPAEISAAAKTKNIAVTKFSPDYVNLTDKVEAAISKQRIDGKPYFTVINRSDFKKVIKEQKLQNSGLVDTSTTVEVGKVLGAQAIISGSVDRPTLKDNHYYVKRTKCRGKGEDRKCWKVKVSCQKRVISLTAQIRMINVKTSKVIFADNIHRQQTWSRCADDSRTIPSKNAGAHYLANSIANNFAYRLTPHYRHISVTLLEDPDIDYTDLQERLLENALLYIEQSR